jgi:ubiquinone/menaquinone biosynthesis C-methylase UbiE
MSDQQSAALERTFSQQTSAFEDQRFNKIFTGDVAWLFERLSLAPEQLALDVAAGTGHAARALAPFVRGVMALDTTPAMLAAGKLAADRAGLHNVLFQRGDAAALPYLDDSFDVVVSRFAVHHFERPAQQAVEMARCLRPGGQLVIADSSTTMTRRSPQRRTASSVCAIPRTPRC